MVVLQVKPGEMKCNSKTHNVLGAIRQNPPVIIRVLVHLLTKTIQNIIKSGTRDSPSIFIYLYVSTMDLRSFLVQ